MLTSQWETRSPSGEHTSCHVGKKLLMKLNNLQKQNNTKQISSEDSNTPSKLITDNYLIKLIAKPTVENQKDMSQISTDRVLSTMSFAQHLILGMLKINTFGP